MPDEINDLLGDDEAQRILEELDSDDQEPAPAATDKKAGRGKRKGPKAKASPAADEVKAETITTPPAADEVKAETITNVSPRRFNVGRISLAPKEVHTLTDQDRADERGMRRIARAIELGLLAAN